MNEDIKEIVEKYSISEEQQKQFFKDLIDYGKKKKIAGSKSLAKLGREMRFTQQRYFDTKSHDTLKNSKKLEEQFDRAVEAVLG